MAPDSLLWRCTACEAEWIRPTADPPGQSPVCLRCDGPLVAIEAQVEPKAFAERGAEGS